MAKGQHIFVKRPGGWLTRGMLHHGIDIGDGTVIHFTSDTSQSARVLRTNIKTFENNGEIEPFPYDQICRFATYEFGPEVSKAISRNYYELGEQVPPPDVKHRHPVDVINEAFRWLGTTFLANQYHIARNNCEHFATACATGYPFSLQVQYQKEYLHNRPSLGGLIGVLSTELMRFGLNPRPEPKDGWYFIGATYRDNISGTLCREHYLMPGGLPPQWFVYNKPQDQGKLVDQRLVPYPLIQHTNHYVDQHNRRRDVLVNN